MTTTNIGGRDVPVRPGARTVVKFSGGKHGPSDADTYEFWTAVRPVRNRVDKTTARCPASADPGERFRLMEGDSLYEWDWEVARNADHLRPARGDELVGWLNKHPGDAPFAETCELGGEAFQVIAKDGRYSLAK